MSHHQDIAVLYHGGCPDGFGAAYAAWKKFGDTAEYIPLKHQTPPPTHIAGKELYLVDFCYDKATMDALVVESKSLTVLDHHEGVQEVTKSMPHFVYEEKQSGAGIAWKYFHPETSVPLFLQIVEKADLFLPLTHEERAIVSYTYAQPFHFNTWDEHVRRVEDPTERAKIVERGSAYREYFDLLVHQLKSGAELVEFEGYTVYLVPGEKMFVSEIGNQLYKERPPFALVVRTSATGLRISLRGDGTVDLTKIAQKYGGNGHPQSAAFSLPWSATIPWKSATT
jgi:uncharacterized protein